MNDLAVATITNSSNALSEHLRRGSAYLANATSAAEILEAKAAFGAAYDESRRVARLAEAKGAHDKVLADIHRAMAEALEGEASAKRLLADEYDAAQARGEIPKHGGKRGNQHTGGKFENAKVANISPSDIHEARIIRDAEEAEPGIVKRTIEEAVEAGEEPTRALVKRATLAKSKRRRHAKPNFNTEQETQHDRDLRMLLGVWEAACASAREAFLEQVVH